MRIFGRSISGRSNSKCEGTEVGVCPACLKNNKMPVEMEESKQVGDDVRRVLRAGGQITSCSVWRCRPL